MDSCIKCQISIPSEECTIRCCECQGLYHLGTCSGISVSSFRTRREEQKKTWKCESCCVNRADAARLKEPPDPVVAILAEISRKLDELLPLKNTVHEIEKSINMMSEKYDSVLAELTRQDSEVKSLKGRVTKLEAVVAESELHKVNTAINDLEYQSRKLNIEMHGIPQEKNECLLGKVNAIASALNIDVLTKQDVSAMHRLPSRNDRVPGVIVRFTCQSIRDQWLEQRKRLPDVMPGHYITENLTAHNRRLLMTAKDWAEKNHFRFCWHRAGKIFVKKKEGDRARVIKSVADLDRLL